MSAPATPSRQSPRPDATVRRRDRAQVFDALEVRPPELTLLETFP
ncbi:MAG: hypothetical protein ACR2LX_03615 [Jatrophihabitans sp.]